MPWPTLTPERARELLEKLDEATILLTEVAGNITVYPGGGAPAHRCREATSAAADAVVHIREMLPAEQVDHG